MSRINCIAALKALSEVTRRRILRSLLRKKLGQQRLYAVTPGLKDHLAENDNILEMDRCTVRFDQLPK